MIDKSSLKIMHVASGDLWAGAEVQLFTLVKTLHDLDNISVQVTLLNHGELEKRLRAQGIPVGVIPESEFNGAQILSRLLGEFRLHSPDVVHTHRLKENILGGLAARIAGNIPSLRTVHGAPEHSPGWLKPHKQILHGLDWFIGRFFQCRIIAVSDALAVLLRQKFPFEKVTVIENGVDIEALAPFSKPEEKLEKPTTPCKIGLVGRLVAVKRIDIFIETAKRLREHYPEFSTQFHVYGDGPLRAKLENFSISLGVQDIVHFEGHCGDIHSEMASLDALLITSDHEGLPMTLLEAMAIGTPIIAHAVGGIPHALGEGDCGNLVLQQTPEAYATAIINLFKHTLLRNKQVRTAHIRILETNSARINAKSYLAQYQAVTSKTGGL